MGKDCLSFGCFQLNPVNGTLLRGGEPLPVGPRGVRLIEALLRRPGEILTKAELMDAAWPDVTVEEANLSVQIAALRKALGPAPGGGEWIATIPRVGYRFVPGADGSGGAALAAAASEARALIGEPPRLRLLGQSRRWWWAAILAASIVAVVGGFVFLRPAEVAPRMTPAVSPSVAVLPFDDMSGNPDLAYFGEGVSQDIISMLARVPNLSVIARNSSFQYKGQADDIRKIGEDLGATHVLEGSVRKDSHRLRIVAQLIDAGTGRHVWAERFDRTGTDPRALQDEVTQKIVAALAGTAGSIALQEYRDAWGKDSADLQEYDYALRVMSRIAHGTPEMAEMADAVLAEGLSKFPRSSLLKAQAASTLIWRFARGWSDSDNPLQDIRRAGELARQVLRDPAAAPMMRANVHITLAYVNMAERRFGQAVAEAEAAIALAPYDGRIVYYLAEIPIAAGRPGVALEWIERAAALYQAEDPRQQELASMKAVALLRSSGPEAALEVLDSINSSDAVVLRTTYMARTAALVLLGRLDEAKLDMERLRELDPGWTQAKHRKRFFYTEPEELTTVLRALAAAGLPEN